MKPSDMDIRWHGRGGQGAITAAKIVANVTGGIRPGGAIIINTCGGPGASDNFLG